MIDDHKTKVSQNTVHIQFINSINGDQYEKVMSYNNISITLYKRGTIPLYGNSKALLNMKNHVLYLALITKKLGAMLRLNGR